MYNQFANPLEDLSLFRFLRKDLSMQISVRMLTLCLAGVLLFFAATSFAHKIAGHGVKEDTRMCLDLPSLSVCISEVDYGE